MPDSLGAQMSGAQISSAQTAAPKRTRSFLGRMKENFLAWLIYIFKHDESALFGQDTWMGLHYLVMANHEKSFYYDQITTHDKITQAMIKP